MNSLRHYYGALCDFFHSWKFKVLVAGIGALLVLCNPLFKMWREAQLADWTETTAHVVKVESHEKKHYSRRRGTYYETVWESEFTFDTADGAQHTAIHPGRLSEGKLIQVIYPADAPEEAILNDDATRYELVDNLYGLGWVLIILMPALFLLGGLKKLLSKLTGKDKH